jgi:hypothetical protein
MEFKIVDRLADIIAGVDERDPAEIRELLYDFAESITKDATEAALRKAEGR